MNNYVTIIGGVNSGTVSGGITVPVGDLSDAQLSNLQAYLGTFTKRILDGTAGFTNFDTINGASYGATISGPDNLLALSNSDNFGTTMPGSISGTLTVSSTYNTVVLQVPGTVTVNGSDLPTTYVLGSITSVALNLNVGNNTVIGATSFDTINANIGNTDITYGGGRNNFVTYAGNNSIVASGSASVVATVGRGYAGTLTLTNDSSLAASVNANAGSATVFGGSAGGTFLGGSSGTNLLEGGNGSVFLVGGGNNDSLIAGGIGATSSSGSNYLFAGAGNETLVASSVTGSNLFSVGVGSDIISTAGAGSQYFFGSSGSASITGSTTLGSNNIYFFGTATGHGGNDIITNFSASKSELIALNGTNIESITGTTLNGVPGALVSLSDGTQITLTGVTSNHIQGSTGGTIIT